MDIGTDSTIVNILPLPTIIPRRLRGRYASITTNRHYCFLLLGDHCQLQRLQSPSHPTHSYTPAHKRITGSNSSSRCLRPPLPRFFFPIPSFWTLSLLVFSLAPARRLCCITTDKLRSGSFAGSHSVKLTGRTWLSWCVCGQLRTDCTIISHPIPCCRVLLRGMMGGGGILKCLAPNFAPMVRNSCSIVRRLPSSR